MSEETPEAVRADIYTSSNSDSRVAIIAIVATAFIALACIAACSLVTYAFLSNPPW